MSIFKSASECKHRGIFKKAQVDEDYDFMAEDMYEDMYDPQDRDWEEEKIRERQERRRHSRTLEEILHILFNGKTSPYRIVYHGSGGPGDEYYTDIKFFDRENFYAFLNKLHNVTKHHFFCLKKDGSSNL
jgi:hypothetical protein